MPIFRLNHAVEIHKNLNRQNSVFHPVVYIFILLTQPREDFHAQPYFVFSAHYNFTLYGDQPEFSMYKFPGRATTYKVNSGGWALYSEPHFQGKVMYHFGSKY